MTITMISMRMAMIITMISMRMAMIITMRAHQVLLGYSALAWQLFSPDFTSGLNLSSLLFLICHVLIFIKSHQRKNDIHLLLLSLFSRLGLSKRNERHRY